MSKKKSKMPKVRNRKRPRLVQQPDYSQIIKVLIGVIENMQVAQECMLRVLKEKEIITDEELKAAIQSFKDSLVKTPTAAPAPADTPDTLKADDTPKAEDTLEAPAPAETPEIPETPDALETLESAETIALHTFAKGDISPSK